MWPPEVLRVLAMLLGPVVLEIVAYATPYWIYTSSGHMGLFTTCYQNNTGHETCHSVTAFCELFNFLEIETWSCGPILMVVRAFISAGYGLGIAAAIIIVVGMTWRRQKIQFLASAGCAVFSALFTVVGDILFLTRDDIDVRITDLHFGSIACFVGPVLSVSASWLIYQRHPAFVSLQSNQAPVPGPFMGPMQTMPPLNK